MSHAVRADKELETAPAWEVETLAGTQCVGASVHLSVNVRNAGDVPPTIELLTPYGSRTVPGVAPGKAAYQSFNTRKAAVPAGTVTVKVTGTAAGAPVTTQHEVPYGTGSCG